MTPWGGRPAQVALPAFSPARKMGTGCSLAKRICKKNSVLTKILMTDLGIPKSVIRPKRFVI